MNQKVLIITSKFPPQDWVGAYGMYRLARLLPEYGWTPHVLTVDTNYQRNEDRTLLSRLPEETTIHTARYIEPTIRGLRMALGGQDRTHAALKRRSSCDGDNPVAVAEGGTLRDFKLLSRAYQFARGRWLENPDACNTWYRPALTSARQIMKEHQIPLVLTSAPDFTSVRLAAAIQREGARWVCDFRDPPMYMRLMHSTNQAVAANQRKIERHAVRNADAITVAAQGIGMILTDMYGPDAVRQFSFIPSGLDEEQLRQVDDSVRLPYPYLIFPGTLTPEYDTEFLEIFAAALQLDEVRQTGIQLVIVGDVTVNRPLVLPAARRLHIENHITLTDYQPQRVALRLLRDALGGVLLDGRTARWWCLHAKAVEYMGMRKRVVAVVPEMSESRLHLERTGLGIFLDGDRQKSVQTLRQFILGRLQLPPINEAECERFTATRQAESFADLFQCVLSGNAVTR